MRRIATAAVLAPALWMLIKLAPRWAFHVVALLAILVAAWECYRMLERGGWRPFKALGLTAVAGVVWSFIGVAPVFDVTVPLLGVTLLATILSMCTRDDPPEMLHASAVTLFPVVFVGLALAHLAAIRRMPGEDGEDLLLLLFLCVILADTGAYYVGTHLGRHRMAPRLSPKKSWEGAAGGLLASVLAALTAHLWFYQRMPMGHALVLGLLLGLAGILGDLSESMVKRATGVKDSSGLLPGHGGLLDRTDSLLFAGPVLYYYYLAFLRGSV